jgi:hypothetical protein
MKSGLVLPAVLICALLAAASAAAATDSDSSAWTAAMPQGFAFFACYKTVAVDQSFAHDTHPDDSFLPNANVPGSAGTTSLARARYIDLGLRYDAPSKGRWTFNVDVAGLFAYSSGNGAGASGWNLDDRQNANDPRPPANAAFIYTDSIYGFDVALGATCGLSRFFYLGAGADLAGLVVDNGWDRFSSKAVQARKLLLVPAGGPKVGLRLTREVALEGTALFARKGVGYDGRIVIHL